MSHLPTAQLGLNDELRIYQCKKVSRSGIRCNDLPTYHSQIQHLMDKHLDSHARYQIQIGMAKGLAALVVEVMADGLGKLFPVLRG